VRRRLLWRPAAHRARELLSELRLADASRVYVSCETSGDQVIARDASSTDVWDMLADGTYVSDEYVSSVGKNGAFTDPIPRCVGGQPPPVGAITGPSAGALLTGNVQNLSPATREPVCAARITRGVSMVREPLVRNRARRRTSVGPLHKAA
jgi:hypothetical protein